MSECSHGIPMQIVKDYGCDECLNEQREEWINDARWARLFAIYKESKEALATVKEDGEEE